VVHRPLLAVANKSGAAQILNRLENGLGGSRGDRAWTSNCGRVISCKFMSDSIYNVSQAQARPPQRIKPDSFAISVRGQVKGFYLSKERLEAMIETMELLGSPDFKAALKEHASGRSQTFTAEELIAG